MMTTQPQSRATSAPAIEARGWRRFAPWISRILLIPPLLILIMISIRFFTDPAHATEPSGVVLRTPEAITDTRVTAGIVLTVVFILLWTFVSRDRLRTGHGVVIALMATVLVVRFFGFAHDGTTLATGTQRVKTGGETIFLTLNSIGFLLQTRANRRKGGAQ